MYNSNVSNFGSTIYYHIVAADTDCLSCNLTGKSVSEMKFLAVILYSSLKEDPKTSNRRLPFITVIYCPVPKL